MHAHTPPAALRPALEWLFCCCLQHQWAADGGCLLLAAHDCLLCCGCVEGGRGVERWLQLHSLLSLRPTCTRGMPHHTAHQLTPPAAAAHAAAHTHAPGPAAQPVPQPQRSDRCACRQPACCCQPGWWCACWSAAWPVVRGLGGARMPQLAGCVQNWLWRADQIPAANELGCVSDGAFARAGT
jgi:hypothetical protein